MMNVSSEPNRATPKLEKYPRWKAGQETEAKKAPKYSLTWEEMLSYFDDDKQLRAMHTY